MRGRRFNRAEMLHLQGGGLEMREILTAFCSLSVRDVLDYAAFCFMVITWTGALFILSAAVN